MLSTFKLLLAAVTALLVTVHVSAQDLAPRAYVITPIHSNAIVLSYAFFSGSILFDGSTPITDATARVDVPIISLYHSFKFFGHSANVTASLPYVVGNFKGTVQSEEKSAYRSGMADSSFRFSVNLKGGPAMDIRQMMKWRQKMLIGASLRVVAPSGQYDPTKLLNLGANHWAFRPEIGLSRRWNNWVLDAYSGVWFYTTNNAYFSKGPGIPNIQNQSSIGAFEGHLSYDVKPRFWASLDGNFWFGGRTSINGIQNPGTEQKNSRVGATLSFPVSKHQALKVSYNRGAYIRFGGDYNNITVGWQYSWLGNPN